MAATIGGINIGIAIPIPGTGRASLLTTNVTMAVAMSILMKAGV